MTNNFSRFKEVRKRYSDTLPEWIRAYHATGRMYFDPYFLHDLMEFTPIEQLVWGDLREAGLPFYPQLPVLNYFLDFGCPFLRIGIECDGKAWHDYDLDKARDARLAANGWMIFRIEGHECKRSVKYPWSEYTDEVDRAEVKKWYSTTSQGIVEAIRQKYFLTGEGHGQEADRFHIEATLFEHCATPGVIVPKPIERKKIGNPRRMSEFMGEYVALLHERAKRNYG